MAVSVSVFFHKTIRYKFIGYNNFSGVAWVHARIDDAPKYFHTREYAVATE